MSLVTADLSRQNLRNLDEAVSYIDDPYVKRILVNRNKLSTFETESNRRFEEVEYVDGSHNRLVSLAGLSVFPNLKSIKVTNNEICELSEVDKCEKMSEIVIYRNKISSVSLKHTMMSLRSLNMARNLISSLDFGLKMPNLVYLNVDRCCLRTLAGIENFKSLRKLSAKKNSLRDRHILHSESVEVLKVSHNQIKSISIFSGMRKLRVLHVKDNPIEAKSLEDRLVFPNLVELKTDVAFDTLDAFKTMFPLISQDSHVSNDRVSLHDGDIACSSGGQRKENERKMDRIEQKRKRLHRRNMNERSASRNEKARENEESDNKDVESIKNDANLQDQIDNEASKAVYNLSSDSTPKEAEKEEESARVEKRIRALLAENYQLLEKLKERKESGENQPKEAVIKAEPDSSAGTKPQTKTSHRKTSKNTKKSTKQPKDRWPCQCDFDIPRFPQKLDSLIFKTYNADEDEDVIPRQRPTSLTPCTPSKKVFVPPSYPFNTRSPRQLPWDTEYIPLSVPRGAEYTEEAEITPSTAEHFILQPTEGDINAKDVDLVKNIQVWISNAVKRKISISLLQKTPDMEGYRQFLYAHPDARIAIYPCPDPSIALDTPIRAPFVVYRSVSHEKMRIQSCCLCAVDLGHNALDPHPQTVPNMESLDRIKQRGYDSYTYTTNGVETNVVFDSERAFVLYGATFKFC